MRILLINPTRERLFEQPSLGLLYVAGALKRAGHEVNYLEGSGYGLEDKIFFYLHPGFMPDVIGFTVMSPLFDEVKRSINFIRKTCYADYHKKMPLFVAGGAHATLMPETLLKIGVDVVIQGEGEKAIVDLLDRISSSKVLPNIFLEGVIIKGAPVADLDTLAFPDRSLLPEKYLKRHSVSIMASRGCPSNCNFCQPTLRKIFGDKVRRRSPMNVLTEILEAKKLGVRYFEFFDDTFTADPDWLQRLCNLLKAAHVRWECLTRVNAVNEEILKMMKDAGCHRITFGVESGCQEILNYYRKGTTVAQIKEAFRLCHKVGIHSHGLFMLGAPIETQSSIRETEQLIKEIKPDSIFISITTPLPFTDLWNDCVKKDAVSLDWSKLNYYNRSALRLEYLNSEYVIASRERILKNFYLRHPLFVIKLFRSRGWSYTKTAITNLFGGKKID